MFNLLLILFFLMVINSLHQYQDQSQTSISELLQTSLFYSRTFFYVKNRNILWSLFMLTWLSIKTVTVHITKHEAVRYSSERSKQIIF